MAKGPLTISPDQAAKNWSQGVANNVPKAQDAIRRLQENPLAKAAERVEAQVAGVIRAAQEGRTQAALLAYNPQEWKDRTIKMMGERMASGATASIPKMTKVMQYLIPTINGAKQAIASMPRGTRQENIARMIAFVNYMADNPMKSA